MSDLQQYLRLELERDPDPGELINLVPNPDGALGAWGWETPVDGSTMRASQTGGVRFLTYQSPGGVPSFFYTVPMEVEAGKWVSAREMAIAVAGQYRLTVEWLNASKVVIGSTTQSPAYTQSSTPRAYGSFQAPGGTFYARLRFDHYDGSGGNPTAGVVSFLGVVLTAADTAGELGWSRTNLVRNPSPYVDTAGWSAEDGVIDTSSAHAWVGDRSFRITKDDGKTGPLVARYRIDNVVPGRDYALQVRTRPSTIARKVTVAARWLDADGKQLSQVTAHVANEALGVWTVPLSGVVTAPTTADKLQLRIVWAGVPEGERHLFDAVMIEQASTVGSYFDGNTADVFGITHDWSGAEGQSTSTETGPSGDPGVVVPVPFQNILGPTSQITVDREELNVGSMSVKLFDAVLDPTQSDLIQMGRRVRLVTTPAEGDPQVLFAGKIFTGSVAYHLLRPDEAKRAEVTLTATDPINALANTSQREGVGALADLPHVLEPAGVPWSVNGDGNQVADPDVVAYNDNASVLDQVAVTRDSVLGYAWVDRNGVLQAWDRGELDATVAADLDEDDYTADLDIDFDLDSLVNSVTVTVWKIIATTGASEPVTFGPYVHAESFRKYGERAQEFVVQGVDASDTAAIQEYAEQILNANALPRLRVNELALPIAGDRVDEPQLDRALLDLYDLVSVANERAGIDEAARVTRIHHEITATSTGGKWLMTLGFTADGSVAPATAVPSPPPGVGQVVEDVRGGYNGSLQDIFDSADEAAQAAANAAASATVALLAANGKNTTIYSTSAPGSAPNSAGDIWFRKDAATQTITGQWQGLGGTSWQQVELASAVIANLDAGKLVAGSAFTNALWVKTNITLGDASTNGAIQTHNFAGSSIGVYIDKFGLVAKGASITGSTITGGLVRTAASGQRIEMRSDGILDFIDSSGTHTPIYGSGGLLLIFGSAQVWSDLHVSGDLTVDGSYPSGGSSWVGSATSGLDMNGYSITDVNNVNASGKLFLGTRGSTTAAPNLRVGAGGEVFEANTSLGPADSGGSGYRLVRVPN